MPFHRMTTTFDSRAEPCPTAISAFITWWAAVAAADLGGADLATRAHAGGQSPAQAPNRMGTEEKPRGGDIRGLSPPAVITSTGTMSVTVVS